MKGRFPAWLLMAAAAVWLTACTAPSGGLPATGETATPDTAQGERAATSETAYTPHWEKEPYLNAARIVGLPESTAPRNQQAVFSHLAIQQQAGGGWQFLNARTGEIFPDKAVEPHFFATLGGELPLFPWVPDPYDEEAVAWLDQLSQQQGIGMAYLGSGAPSVNPPVWMDGQWLSMGAQLSGLRTFDAQYNPLVFPDPVNVALYVAPDNPNWRRATGSGDPGLVWYYVGDGTVRDYDGVLLVDDTGQPLDDRRYEDGQPYREGVAAVRQDGKWGYLDAEGKPITDFCYEPMISADAFSREPSAACSANEGLIPVRRDGLCGLIDTSGREVVPLIFEDITSVYDGMAWAKQGGLWGLLRVPPETAA